MYSESNKDILNRMLKNSKTSSSEGTLIYDALMPSAFEIERLKITLDEVLNKAFAKTSFENNYSKELELKAFEHGIIRKKGSYATGFIKFQGVKDTKIPIETLVQTNLGVQYKTTIEERIKEDGFVIIPIIALEEGTSYNIKANMINEMPIKLAGISYVTNEKAIENGRDTENDESLYNRLILKVQKPSTSGNIYDYENWALEINGVGNVIVKPLWNGNGTVKVILVNTSGRAPSKEIIKNVEDHIEKNRPIGATVTVCSVLETNIKLSFKLILEDNSNLEEVRKSIIENIDKYLKKIALKDNKIRFNRIANCILSLDSVIDFEDLKINDGNKDILLNEDTIGVLSEVVCSEA